MITFSPFNPIYFGESGIADDAMADYVHIFSTDDHILTQIFHDVCLTLPMMELIDCTTGETLIQLNWGTYTINESEAVSFYELRGLDVGDYRLKVGEYVSNHIHVTDDIAELNETFLMQYTMRTNVARTDIYPIVNGLPKYFEIRLYGGFKDDGWSFSVENDYYVTDKDDIVEIYSIESTDKVLIIGNSEGEPIWIGNKIGLVLACDLLFIDGCRFSKSDDSALEITICNTEGTKFLYSVTLRQAHYVDAKFERIIRSSLRRVPGHMRRAMSHLRKV